MQAFQAPQAPATAIVRVLTISHMNVYIEKCDVCNCTMHQVSARLLCTNCGASRNLNEV